MIGPNWARPIWPIDADLQPDTGIALLQETVRFLTPGNVLGLPSVAVPMGFVGRRPLGISVYADLWREDLCLHAAEIIEAHTGACTPVDPSFESE